MISKEDKLRFETLMKVRYKCKCGHVVIIPAYRDNLICNYCGRTVYKSEKDEFKFKLERMMTR